MISNYKIALVQPSIGCW